MTTDDELVLTAVKTPMMPRPTTRLLPGDLTLVQSLAELRNIPPKDANAARVLQQLERETSSGKYDFLVVTRTGQIIKAKPRTPLRDIAVPREVHTSRGLEEVSIAAFEVQAYAPVGGNEQC